jgi:hypothetical protein
VLILYVWTATFAFGVALMAFIPFSYGLLAGIVAIAVAAALTFGPLRRPRGSRRHAHQRASARPAEDADHADHADRAGDHVDPALGVASEVEVDRDTARQGG